MSRQSVELPDVAEEEVHSTGGSDSGVGLDEVGLFAYRVDHNL